MNIVDYVVLGIIGYYFWRGWSKGFFLSLLGPLSLIICFFYAYFYFKKTNNFMISLAICFLAPVVINIIASGIIGLLKKARGAHEDHKAGEVPGRLLGGVISASWISLVTLSFLTLVAMVPIKIPGLEEFQTKIRSSGTINIISAFMGNQTPFFKKNVQPVDLENVRDKFSKFEKTTEFSQLMEDERVKDLLSDQELLEKIKKKDFMAFLNDNRIQEVMFDPELAKKFLKLNMKMIEMNKGGANADDIYQNH